jgi:hypothetical protein
MLDTTQTAVLLTLDRTARPIQGQIAVNRGPGERFHGWLELNDRLEQALSSSSSPDELSDMVRGLHTDAGCLHSIQPARRHPQ